MKMNRIFDILDNLVENHTGKDVLARRDANGQWQKFSVEAYRDYAYKIASALLELGFEKGDKVVTIMQNRPEWNFLDMGIAMAGCVHVPVYPTLTPSDYSYIINHSDAKAIFVGIEQIFRRVEPAISELEHNPIIYTIANIEGYPTFDEFLALGNEKMSKWEPVINDIKKNISPDDIATLIYTSGTTSRPKGVLLRHKSMVINAAQVTSMNNFTSEANILSFLPLCHVYERVVNYMYQMLGSTIYYATNLSTIAKDLKDIHADGFCAVPRVFEMMFDKFVSAEKDLKGVKKLIYHKALKMAKVYDNQNHNFIYKKKYEIADKLVYSKWREGMGGHEMIIVSGGSSIQERIIRTFTAAKMRIYEGYGLTETAPVISVNSPIIALRPGTVGTILDCIEFKLADDGEILTKGDCLMAGYYKNEEATQAAIDADGWFHTGDIGTLVEGKYLKITDRKKEIFKLSTGKYVAPQMLENRLKESSFIEQAMVIGENEKIAAAIIVPNFDRIKAWCKKHRVPYTAEKEIIHHPEIVKRVQREITRINENLAEHEQIRKFRMVADVWSPQTGELSQTLKLKRAVLYNKYDALCREIYQYDLKSDGQ